MTQAIARKSLYKSLYESDFLLWTQDTIAKLRIGNLIKSSFAVGAGFADNLALHGQIID